MIVRFEEGFKSGNIYAPTSSQTEQLDLLESIKTSLEKLEAPLFLGGDYNVCYNLTQTEKILQSRLFVIGSDKSQKNY